MQIIDFTVNHIEQAIQIAKQNYETERKYVPALPHAPVWPNMIPLAENNLGVAAFEGERMIGFLCCYGPFQNAFGSTNVAGVFSPMHSNGTVAENRAVIYARIYQAAAEKWVKAGAASHAVCLYAHDKEAQGQFFRYGFGLRCIDAIRGIDEISVPACEGYSFSELSREEFHLILPTNKMLIEHLEKSPTFLKYPAVSDSVLLERITCPDPRYFAATKNGELVAYIKITDDGETFVSGIPDSQNICGAFCLPEHRGKGLSQNLLNYVIRAIAREGYQRLGVDFESFNSTAYGFWLKYFDAYTHSVVRRIDENILN